MRQGMDPKQAAIESAVSPSWPLLSATLVASLAFYPIFASDSDSGEYCRTLFTVIASALVLSWAVSMFITPLQCLDMLPKPKPAKPGEDGESVDEFDKGFYKAFKKVLGGAIRARYLTLGVMVALLAVAIVGFGNVRQMFFPDAQRPQLMIDYWAPNGTRIQQVSAELRELEDHIKGYKNEEGNEVVTSISTFMGAGPHGSICLSIRNGPSFRITAKSSSILSPSRRSCPSPRSSKAGRPRISPTRSCARAYSASAWSIPGSSSCVSRARPKRT